MKKAMVYASADLPYLAARVRGSILRSRREPRTPSPGLPRGLTAGDLEAVCRHVTGEDVAEVHHLHLSPFKIAGGAERITVSTTSGRPWRIIFKDCRYGEQDAPGLVGFPARIGRQEYAIYSTADGALRSLLPEVYLAEQTGRDRYRYLLEDLGATHRKPVSPRALRRAAAFVPKMTSALATWYQRTAEARQVLTRYDRPFMNELIAFGSHVFTLQQEQQQSEAMSYFLSSRVTSVVGRDVHDEDLIRPVHGDLNRASVLLRKGGVRFIDWERAGLGLPHLDLAALLDHAHQGVESQALALYATSDPRIEPHEHTRLYHWARVAMAYLNASVLCNELLAEDHEAPRRDRRAYVSRLAASTERSLRVVER